MKRLICLLLCLMLVPGALAEVYAVSYTPEDGPEYITCCMLLRDDGTVLVGPDACASLYELTAPETPAAERRFCATSLGDFTTDAYGDTVPLCAMLDAEGQPLTGYEFTYLYRDYETGLITFGRADGRMGILRPDGAVAVEGPYNLILPRGDGWLVMQTAENDAPGALCLVDAEGAVTDTGLRAQGIRLPQTEGDPLVLEDNDGAICVDADLKPCFEGRLGIIEAFQDGLAVARPAGGDLCGVIDAEGRFVLAPEYADVYHFKWKGRALLLAFDADRRGYSVFDRAMTLWSHVDLRAFPNVSDTSFYPNENGLIEVSLYDSDYNATRMKFDPMGRPVQEADDGRSLITYFTRAEGTPQRAVLEMPDGALRYSVVDLEGNRCGGEYQSLDTTLWKDGQGRFLSSVYKVERNAEGDEVINWSTYRMGVVDENGDELLPPVYRELSVLDLDRYWVTEGTRTGMIDGAGRWYFAFDAYDSLVD